MFALTARLNKQRPKNARPNIDFFSKKSILKANNI